ncbi:hypothetical protein EJB05_28242, partial [Eragrostis curvula]
MAGSDATPTASAMHKAGALDEDAALTNCFPMIHECVGGRGARRWGCRSAANSMRVAILEATVDASMTDHCLRSSLRAA